MWAPNVIFAVVGFIALWRLRTQSTSARGGSWLDRFVRRRHP
jgi:hypothetical protein